jgi:hypothetical protein
MPLSVTWVGAGYGDVCRGEMQGGVELCVCS